MSRFYHAAVLSNAKDIKLEPRPLLPPQEGYATVAIVSTGLCGSDHHYYCKGRNGDFTVKQPLVLGHEAGGVIVRLGPGVTHLKVGQRVSIEPGIPCNPAKSDKCQHCRDGRYNLCTQMSFASSASKFPHTDGTLQGYMNHPARLLHALPADCTWDDAALAEPLSVVMHASRRVNFTEGQSVLVFGVGAIGMLACKLARASGASRVCAVDIIQSKLEFSKANGYAESILCLPLVPRGSHDEAMRTAVKHSESILEAFGMPAGFDVIYECSGAESSIQTAVHCARRGGKIGLVGMGASQPTLQLSAAALREVDLVGVFRYHDTWPEALDLLGSGRLLGIEKIITHRLPLNKVKSAFELISQGSALDGPLVVKVVVESRIEGLGSGPYGPTQATFPPSSIPKHNASIRLE